MCQDNTQAGRDNGDHYPQQQQQLTAEPAGEGDSSQVPGGVARYVSMDAEFSRPKRRVSTLVSSGLGSLKSMGYCFFLRPSMMASSFSGVTKWWKS